MSIQSHYNNEDIFSRAIISGVLQVLNFNIEYQQVWGNQLSDIEKINLPWLYNQSGDERFMQDFYTQYADCNFPRKIDSETDIVPRGLLTYTGSTIAAQRITSRFVQGQYLKEINGKLQTYTSFLYSIPLTAAFDCQVVLDNFTNGLKIEQAIREAFYKTITFYVYFRGMRVGATVGFPEQYTLEKQLQYSFQSSLDNYIKLNFQLEVETYQPVFDKTVEMNANNTMKGIGYRVFNNNEKSDGQITITNPSGGLTIPKGSTNLFEFNYNNEGDIINKVDIYWVNNGENERHIIEKGVINNEYYIWNIPDDFTNFKDPNIIWEENDNISINRAPIVKVVPDTTTKQITPSSFYIIDQGYFLSKTEDSSINVILEMKDTQNRVVYTDDNAIRLNITGYMLDKNNPIAYLDPSIYFVGDMDYKIIDVQIANSVNNDVFGVVKNLKIV
jgi:hypothetical protein